MMRGRTVEIAPHAGFCFGVRRAVEALEKAMREATPNATIATLGPIIHNEAYVQSLQARGIMALSEEEAQKRAEEASPNHPFVLIIRAHGIPQNTEKRLQEIAENNPYFTLLDCTCPFVKKIHCIAEECDPNKEFFVFLGDENHPEVKGVMSRVDGEKYVCNSPEEIETILLQRKEQKNDGKIPILAAQTTQNLCKWNKTEKILKKLYTNAKIFGTICSVTEERQSRARELAARCDGIVVVGGRQSANTQKLYQICRERCGNTVWIGAASELDVSCFTTSLHIGIVAGASTPSEEIQEVYKTMSEIIKENFEEMLEAQCLTLNTGDVVTGTVTHVSDAELQLDLSAGVTGYIKAEQITDDPAYKLTENFKNGDQVEGFVIRVSDIEGVAELSKKRVDADKNWQSVVDACENKTVLEGKVTEAVRGGVVIIHNANRIFVPASQTGVPKDEELSTIVGNTVSFKVIEIKAPKKAIGSIRLVQREERRAQEAEFWANIEVGKAYHGTVKSLTSFGAFVDLGGVDGMVHVTELSWKRIKNPAEVVSVGDELDVFVKSFDPEKKRISLGYKTEESNPWNIFKSQYAVGDIASVKIVNMMPFGAFAEIVDDVDGLIHISQIAMQRIAKPADLLEIGQVVDARIIEIDDEKKKVSLSIRALLEEAAEAAEAMPEDYVAEEAAAEEAVAEEAPAEETAE
ncbi:MAG: 4-hydroxy-3-methylbut-2-enyl diphosphate reductase [Ruminococcaceae bacterium]|nr:4-hydroxy-3-methylbut-2-enyl diphosphate reductase [Oscillospiraceae bacterium]